MISPPRFVERDYEEDIRVAEPDYYGDEDFRGYREREVSTVRRRRADSEVPEFKEEIFKEEVLEVKEEEPFPRRGKTKMPRRLVNKMAIIELGYPFEEEVSQSGQDFESYLYQRREKPSSFSKRSVKST